MDVSLGTFSCDSLSCVSSSVQSKKKHRHDINNNNTNNNNNTPTIEDQHHLLQFFLFDLNPERNFHLKVDSTDKRLIRFVNISHRLQALGIQNGK